MKFFVIGSCYSGYMFKDKLLGSFANGNIEMVYQHQHDSYIGIMSEPVSADLKGVTSKYQWDFDHFAESVFRKDILEKIKQTSPDYIMLDSYAEVVCPVAKISENQYVSNNYYISSSSLSDLIKKAEIIDVFDERRFALFEKYFSLFIEKVRGICPDVKFILVKAHAAYELFNCNTKESSLFAYNAKTEKINALRDKYDEYILKNVEGIKCLDMTQEYYPADTLIAENFSYEASHNHYADAYYKEEHHKLLNIVIDDLLNEQKKTKYFNQAVAIRAYGDFQMLFLLARIYKDFFFVYILINRDDIGTKFTFEQIERLRKIPNVYVIAKDRAPKGSYNELLGLMDIAKMAFSRPDMNYLHYTADSQMPVRSSMALYNYFEKEAGNRTFLNLYYNGSREAIEKTADYTYRYYYFFYNEDLSDPLVFEMYNESIRSQKKLGIKRNGIGNFSRLYKGVYGGSITRRAFEYCRDYVKANPDYLEDIKFTRLGSEFFLHTILFNS